MAASYRAERIKTEMEEAINELKLLKIFFDRPNTHQLKIGPVNYFPTKATIHVDGESSKRTERGFDALLGVLKSLDIYKGGGTAVQPAPRPNPPTRAVLDLSTLGVSFEDAEEKVPSH